MTQLPSKPAQTRSRMRRYKRISVFQPLCVLLYFAVISLTFISEIAAAPSAGAAQKNIKYAVIVDAGSSGSRIYVYKYDSTQAVPNVEQIKDESGKPWAHKREPGISSLAGKLGEVRAYMADLMKHLNEELPESLFPRQAWTETPFMWFATAGMRLLKAKDADDLTQKIREVAKDKTVVPFHFEARWARTLSGEEEGAFAWISLNFLNGFFTEEGVEEYGVVETGGASSQMTFLAKGNILSNKFLVLIDRKVYPLYTHSFLYFGQDQIMKRIFHNECLCKPAGAISGCTPSINNNAYNGQPVKSACLIKDYEKKGYAITHEDTDYIIDLVGTGDPMQCAKEMDFLFRPDYDCFTRPCSFAGIYQPPFEDQKKFYGTSAIRYAVKDLGLLEETNNVTWPQIRAAADDYCQLPLDSLDAGSKYAWSRCLTGIFVAKEFEHLQFATNHQITIQKFDTWTVGAVLYQLELMEILLPDIGSGGENKDVNSASSITLSTNLAIIALLGISFPCLFLCLCCL